MIRATILQLQARQEFRLRWQGVAAHLDTAPFSLSPPERGEGGVRGFEPSNLVPPRNCAPVQGFNV